VAAAAITTTQVEPDRAGTSRKWLIALAVMLGTSLEVLDVSIVNVALPHMQGTFSASVDEISWVLTSYLVANGIMIPMTGWVASRLGRKRYFLTSVAIFITASALCGAARSLGQMILFRLCQGAAGAAMIPSSQVILMETFPPEERQLAMAVWGMGIMVAPILGPTLGGWITDNWSWRWNFYINLPLGALAFIMTSAFVHDPAFLSERRARAGKVDYFGILCLVISIGLLQIVLDRGQRADWFDSPWIIASTALSALAFVTLIFRELRFSDPILDLRFLRQRVFSSAVLMATAMSFGLFGTLLLSPLFLQELMGYSPWKAGLLQAPRGLGGMAGMLLVGQAARHGFNTAGFVGIGFALAMFGSWVTSRLNLDISMWAVLWPNAVMGLGFGMIHPTASAAALSGVARDRTGFAASLYNMMRNTGAAIGIAFMTNMLLTQQQIHQARLTEHFTVFDAWRLTNTSRHRPGAPGFAYLPQLVSGQKQGFALVYRSILAQASMLAFNDIYCLLTAVMLVMIPSFLFLRVPKTTGGSAPQ
jgi:DHA2 family multidrug resistance protein